MTTFRNTLFVGGSYNGRVLSILDYVVVLNLPVERDSIEPYKGTKNTCAQYHEQYSLQGYVVNGVREQRFVYTGTQKGLLFEKAL
jgi:hypothetical protein